MMAIVASPRKRGELKSNVFQSWATLRYCLALTLLVALFRSKHKSVLIEREHSTPLGEDNIDDQSGGFCPASSCKIGQTSIREAFHQAPQAVKDVQSNPSNQFVTVHAITPDSVEPISFEMFIRDPIKDKFISGTIAAGEVHDPPIQKLVVKSLYNREGSVLIDVGANVGYFTATALALGAKTISFEPFYDNAGVIMSTIQKNGWEKQSTLYMNAVGYESNRVTMKSTSAESNLSNMHVSGSTCISDSAAQTVPGQMYGFGYMDTVSLDLCKQIIQT